MYQAFDQPLNLCGLSHTHDLGRDLHRQAKQLGPQVCVVVAHRLGYNLDLDQLIAALCQIKLCHRSFCGHFPAAGLVQVKRLGVPHRLLRRPLLAPSHDIGNAKHPLLCFAPLLDIRAALGDPLRDRRH